jgi:integrase
VRARRLTDREGSRLAQIVRLGKHGSIIGQAGLQPRAGARPRPHDLRHTFATQTMIDPERTEPMARPAPAQPTPSPADMLSRRDEYGVLAGLIR